MRSRSTRRIAGRGNLRNRRPAEGERHRGWVVFAAVLGATATFLASVGSLYFSGQAIRRSTEQARQAQVAQTSERFARLVDQLGSNSAAVRLGAVYSFARLMRDSPVDQESVSELLNGFVRTQIATTRTRPPSWPGRWRLPADALAALKVLVDQPRPRIRPGAPAGTTPWPTVLLQDLNLSHFDLNGLSLAEADFSRANLQATELDRSSLVGAKFTRAYMRQTHAVGANFTGADLTDADLEGAILSNARLVNILCSVYTRWPEYGWPTPKCWQGRITVQR
jgi:hypothetical protein